MHVSKLRLATIALSLFSPLAVQAVEFIDRDFPLLSYGQSFVLSWNHPNGVSTNENILVPNIPKIHSSNLPRTNSLPLSAHIDCTSHRACQ